MTSIIELKTVKGVVHSSNDQPQISKWTWGSFQELENDVEKGCLRLGATVDSEVLRSMNLIYEALALKYNLDSSQYKFRLYGRRYQAKIDKNQVRELSLRAERLAYTRISVWEEAQEEVGMWGSSDSEGEREWSVIIPAKDAGYYPQLSINVALQKRYG